MQSSPNSLNLAKDNRSMRRLLSVVFLVIIYACHKTFGAVMDGMITSIPPDGDLTKIILSEGFVVPRQTRYFGLKNLDNFLALYVGVFTPAIAGFDVIGRLQILGGYCTDVYDLDD
jgi:hypothetical protein